MTRHTKYAPARPRIFEVVDLALAVATFEAVCAKRLITCEDCEVFNLVSAS